MKKISFNSLRLSSENMLSKEEKQQVSGGALEIWIPPGQPIGCSVICPISIVPLMCVGKQCIPCQKDYTTGGYICDNRYPGVV